MSRSLGEPGHPGQTDANGESHWKDIGIRKPWGTVMRWKTSSPGPGSQLCAVPPPKWGGPGADGKTPSAKNGSARQLRSYEGVALWKAAGKEGTPLVLSQSTA